MSSSRLLSTNSTHISAVRFCPTCTYRLLPAGATQCVVCSDIPANQTLYRLDVAGKELYLKIPFILCVAALLITCLIAIFGAR